MIRKRTNIPMPPAPTVHRPQSESRKMYEKMHDLGTNGIGDEITLHRCTMADIAESISEIEELERFEIPSFGAGWQNIGQRRSKQRQPA